MARTAAHTIPKPSTIKKFKTVNKENNHYSVSYFKLIDGLTSGISHELELNNMLCEVKAGKTFLNLSQPKLKC